MDNQQIINSVDGRKIRLEAYLGSGQIAVVYKGTVEGSGEAVAIKFPASEAQSDTIKQECELLEDLNTRLNEPRPVPWAKMGKDVKGRDVLILEFVEDDLQLGKRLFAMRENALEHDKLALQAAAQYARLLEALHSIPYTCQDRKTPDLRWLTAEQTSPHNGRLVVLDWNAVKKDSREFAKDISLFGENWYQLITGKISPSRLDPLKDELWRDGRVSLGVRRLICQMLSPAPGEQIKTAQEASQKIGDLLQVYQRAAADLHKEGLSLHSEVKDNNARVNEFLGHGAQTLETDKLDLFQPEKEWRALICLDLAALDGESGTKERDECLELVRGQGQRLVGYAEHFIELEAYKLGQNVIEWAKRVTAQTGNAAFELTVARRKILVEASQAALEEGLLYLREIWPKLLEWIKRLEEGLSREAGSEEWVNLQAELAKILTTFEERGKGSPQRAARLLDNLKYEVAWQATLAKVKECEAEGRYEEALETLAGRPEQSLAEDWFHQILAKGFTSIAVLESSLKGKTEQQKRTGSWKEEIDPCKVLGNRDHIDYLLRVRLKDIAEHIGADEEVKVRQWLNNLRGFYFCVEGNDLDRLCDVAVSLWQETPEVWSKATQGEIAKHLNMLYGRAKNYAVMDVPAYNSESLRILGCLADIRSGIQDGMDD